MAGAKRGGIGGGRKARKRGKVSCELSKSSKLKSVVFAEGEKTQNLGDWYNKVIHILNSDKSLGRIQIQTKAKTLDHFENNCKLKLQEAKSPNSAQASDLPLCFFSSLLICPLAKLKPPASPAIKFLLYPHPKFRLLKRGSVLHSREGNIELCKKAIRNNALK